MRREEYEHLQSSQEHGSAPLLFLLDFFEDDLPLELAAVCGVQAETARRWLRGGAPSGQNYSRCQALFRLFFALRHGADMSNQKALNFYKQRKYLRASIQGGFPAYEKLDNEIATLLQPEW